MSGRWIVFGDMRPGDTGAFTSVVGRGRCADSCGFTGRGPNGDVEPCDTPPIYEAAVDALSDPLRLCAVHAARLRTSAHARVLNIRTLDADA